eukprot:8406065-Pyramimonas_sp.AAC.1
MSGHPRQVTVPRLKKPSAFPLHRPVGCDPRPLEWDDLLDQLSQGDCTKDRLDAVTSQWVQRAEVALSRVLHVDGDPRYRGRGGPPK